jgi:hypothetical protein
MPDFSVEGIARSYILAVGSHDLNAVENLLSEDFVATFAGTTLDKAGWQRDPGSLHRPGSCLHRV